MDRQKRDNTLERLVEADKFKPCIIALRAALDLAPGFDLADRCSALVVVLNYWKDLEGNNEQDSSI